MALETAFPYNLRAEELRNDRRTFEDLFQAFNSAPVMLALQDVHTAAPRAAREEAQPRAGKEMAKKAAVPSSSVIHGDAMPPICYDFIHRGTCARGDTCKYRHAQVVDAPAKK